MPYYLVQASYTPESWNAQVKNPRTAVDRIRPVVEAVGGTLEAAYYCLGDYDVVAIAQCPDDRAAAALGMGISAGGAVRTYKTTQLMSMDDGVAAMQEANKISSIYAPPT